MPYSMHANHNSLNGHPAHDLVKAITRIDIILKGATQAARAEPALFQEKDASLHYPQAETWRREEDRKSVLRFSNWRLASRRP